jgi:hypothetical protein
MLRLLIKQILNLFIIENLCLNLDPDFMNLNLQNCLVQVKASIEKGMGVLHKQVTVLMYHSLL